jgi:hypothetical protein
MPEKPGKGAKATWMSTCELAVTADDGMWPGHDGLNIGFVHGKTQHLGSGFLAIHGNFCLQQLHQRCLRVGSTDIGNLGDSHAVVAGLR